MLACETVGRGVARVVIAAGIWGFPDSPGRGSRSAPGTGHPGGGSTRNSPGFTRNHTGITGISCSKLPTSRLSRSCSSMVLVVLVDSQVFDWVRRCTWASDQILPLEELLL